MKKLNVLIIFSMIIGTLYYVVFKFNSNRVLSYLAIIPLILAPLLLVKSRFKLEVKELFFYYLFIFLSYFLGCVVNLYNTTNWYDVLVHFCSGIFIFFGGLFILDRIDVCRDNLIFKIFFSFLVVMSVAGLWELFEFMCDILLGMNLQHSNTGVMDTMIDILVAFIGGILSSIGYYVVIKK